MFVLINFARDAIFKNISKDIKNLSSKKLSNNIKTFALKIKNNFQGLATYFFNHNLKIFELKYSINYFQTPHKKLKF